MSDSGNYSLQPDKLILNEFTSTELIRSIFILSAILRCTDPVDSIKNLNLQRMIQESIGNLRMIQKLYTLENSLTTNAESTDSARGSEGKEPESDTQNIES